MTTFDTWVLPPICSYLLDVPGSPPPGCACLKGGRLQVSTTSPSTSISRSAQTLPGPMSPSLMDETFYPTESTFFITILTVAIAPCAVLVSISISSIPQWLRVARCNSL